MSLYFGFDDIAAVSGGGVTANHASRVAVVLGDFPDAAWRLTDGPAGVDVGELFRTHDVVFVPCSWRNRAETEVVRRQLALDTPFVTEDGAALFFPVYGVAASYRADRDVAGYSAIELALPRGYVLKQVRRVAARRGLTIVTLADMSTEQVALEFDLPPLRACLAKLREYDEPFRVLDGPSSAVARMVADLRSMGIDCIVRGSYVHARAGASLPAAVGYIQRLYREKGRPVVTVAGPGLQADHSIGRLVDAIVWPEQSRCFRRAAPDDLALAILDWADSLVAIARVARARSVQRAGSCSPS